MCALDARDAPAPATAVGALLRVVFKIAFISTVVVNGAWFWVIFRRSRPYLAEGGAVAGLTQIYGSLAFNRIYPGHKAGAIVAIVTTILIDFAILLGVTIVALRVATALPIL